ncbi:AP2 domain-containing protein [Enterococcus faecalis]|uniref:AP2 domain-containing protein n=1 Tax=Enterococcus faecalis TaxID=1351 RepID=UPI000FCBA47D
MKERYGHLVVIEEIIKNGYKMYRCLCDCGNETLVYRSNLLSGRTKSCGCGNVKNRLKYKDLSNKSFGKLTAIKPTNMRSEKSVVWECDCSCGNKTYASAKRLLKGDVKSCGCLRRKQYHIKNKKFGFLTALYPLDDKCNWKTKWVCQCDCGNICDVSYSNLAFDHTKSCGCLKKKETRTCIEGTVLECLNSKLPKNNTSGVKGVYRCRGKWVAYITFKKRRYHLGTFDSLKMAAQARKSAENKLFKPLIDKYSE